MGEASRRRIDLERRSAKGRLHYAVLYTQKNYQAHEWDFTIYLGSVYIHMLILVTAAQIISAFSSRERSTKKRLQKVGQ